MTTTSHFRIIAAEFNKPLIDAMLKVAREEMQLLGLQDGGVVRVPGAFEIPIIADFELNQPNVRGLIVLGYIEKGETLHGEVMGHVVHQALVDLQLRYKKGIGIGIIGPGATPEQAQVRHVGSAKAAVRAVHQVTSILSRTI